MSAAIEQIEQETFESKFNALMDQEFMTLPRYRLAEQGFIEQINNIYNRYLQYLEENHITNKLEFNKIEEICKGIIRALTKYYDGFTAESYIEFKQTINSFLPQDMTTYQKSGYNNRFQHNDPLELYRIRKVTERREYNKQEIFHTPFHMRETVSSCRYSIAGYPCLYLGTTLEICLTEIGVDVQKDNVLTSMFQINREIQDHGIDIKVIDMGVKPQDFSTSNLSNDIGINNRRNKKKYLRIYPLIAACSIVVKNRDAKFVPEYIIPQQIMQWIREKGAQGHNKELWGIRYYSCRGLSNENKGFNYVFPTKYESFQDESYCNTLTKVFKYTSPVLINDFYSIDECRDYLKSEFRKEYNS